MRLYTCVFSSVKRDLKKRYKPNRNLQLAFKGWGGVWKVEAKGSKITLTVSIRFLEVKQNLVKRVGGY